MLGLKICFKNCIKQFCDICKQLYRPINVNVNVGHTSVVVNWLMFNVAVL